MEYQNYSILTSGPLSAAAQMVMAALRAQYAGRIDRRLHSESGSSGRACKLSQNQGTFRNTHDTPTQTKILHEQRSFKQSSVGEMALLSQPDLQLLHNINNPFNQRGADKQVDGRLVEYVDDCSLSGCHSSNNIPGPRRSPPEPDPQGEELFPRDVLVNIGVLQSDVGLPETHSRISSRKERILPPASVEQYYKSAVAAHSPPVKRWRFGNLQIPIPTCSGQFEEVYSGQKSEGMDPKRNVKVQLWSSDGKSRVSGDIEVDPNSCAEVREEFGFNAVLLGGGGGGGGGGGVTDTGCESAHIEMKEDLKSLAYHKHLEETLTFRNTSHKNVFSDSCHDSAIHKMLSYGSLLPVHHTSGSHGTSDFDPCTDGSEKSLAGETVSATAELFCHPADQCINSMLQFNMKNNQMETQESTIEPEQNAAFKVTETQQDPERFSEAGQRSSGGECVQSVTPPAKRSGKWEPTRSLGVSPQITLPEELQSPATSSISGDVKVPLINQAQKSKGPRQLRHTLKTVQNQGNMAAMTTTPLKEHKQQSNVEIISVLKAAQQRRFASEENKHIRLEMDRCVDKTSETGKNTLALISDPRVCDTSHLSQEQRMCVLEEVAAARALVSTMVYQDGSTQLDPEQKCPLSVCGVLVLLKTSLNSLVVEETGATKERLLYLRLEQTPAWAQQDLKHNKDLFTREIFMKMMCGTQMLVCYKSKDLLRTTLQHFNKDVSWKQVVSCQVLDPQIAAWLLDPANSASCFEDLFKKYCAQLIIDNPAQSEPRNSKVTRVISSLSHLHGVMVELRNKLETRGLWQLYFCMEQKMIPVLAAMESHMIHVDRDALKKTSEMLGTKMKQLEQEAHLTAGQKFLVSSSSQLRLVLFEKLRLHECCENKKLPKTTLKQQQSTSEAVLLQLQDLHPLPKIILEYRQVHKIKSTFLDGILSCMTKKFISSTWNQTSSVSGRLSAKHPNFQALPRQPIQISRKQQTEGKEAELVTVHPRTMFIPREGWTFLSADFCQVELRLLAHLSSDPELLSTFQNPDADFFSMLASQWKGVSEESVSAEDREKAKRIVYSVIYGAGKERLSGILGVSADEASRFQDTFLQKYKKVQTFIQATVQHCHKYGYVKSIMGRRRSLPHIHSTDWGIRNQAERQAVNFVVQGSAADLCKMAMIHICSLVASSSTLTARLLAQIHDELLFEVDDSQVDDFAVLVKKTMESLQHVSCLGVSLSVPLKVSVSTGRSWGSMCEVDLHHAATTYIAV